MFDKDGVPGAKTGGWVDGHAFLLLEPNLNTCARVHKLEFFSVFYSTTSNICGSVEEFALEHFRSSADLPEGLHAEGAVFNTLCAVLFWTVMIERYLSRTG